MSNVYWDMFGLIKDKGFTESQLIQLIATDLQSYEKEAVSEYLDACKKDWLESENRAKELLARVKELNKLTPPS